MLQTSVPTRPSRASNQADLVRPRYKVRIGTVRQAHAFLSDSCDKWCANRTRLQETLERLAHYSAPLSVFLHFHSLYCILCIPASMKQHSNTTLSHRSTRRRDHLTGASYLCDICVLSCTRTKLSLFTAVAPRYCDAQQVTSAWPDAQASRERPNMSAGSRDCLPQRLCREEGRIRIPDSP